MRVFRCDVVGCEKEAKIGGKCVKHACEEAKARELGTPPPVVKGPEPPTRPEPEEKKEKDMGDKTATCVECKRELNEDERVYKGRCADCRSKGKATRKKRERASRKAAAPKGAPSKKIGADDSLITRLQTDMLYHADKARAIRETLTTIKELTGEDFEIPEMEI